MSASNEIVCLEMVSNESIDSLESRICAMLKCDKGRVACELQSSQYLCLRNMVLRHIQGAGHPGIGIGGEEGTCMTVKFPQGLLVGVEILGGDCAATLWWDHCVYPEEGKESLFEVK